MIPHDASPEYMEGYLATHVMERAGEPGEGWRRNTLFDFSDCPHGMLSIIPVRTENGSWDIEVCNTCATQVGKHCTHERMEWFADGHVLICRNCGIDGT